MPRQAVVRPRKGEHLERMRDEDAEQHHRHARAPAAGAARKDNAEGTQHFVVPDGRQQKHGEAQPAHGDLPDRLSGREVKGWNHATLDLRVRTCGGDDRRPRAVFHP